MTKGIKNKFFGRNTNESFKKNTNKKLDDDFNIVDKKINKTIRPFYIILVLILIVQFIIWFFATSKIKHTFTITPLPPSDLEMSVFSFGDKQLGEMNQIFCKSKIKK